MPLFQTSLKSSIAAIALTTFSTTAFADVDGQNVVDLLTAQLELQGLELKTQSVATDGNNVVLQNIELDVGEGDPVKVDSFLLQNVDGNPDEGYVIERMALPPFSNSADGISFSFGGLTVDGYFVAGPDVTDPLLKSNLYRKIAFGPVSAGPNGKTAFSMSGGESNVSPYRPGGTLEYDMIFNDIMIDFSASPDAQTRAAMSAIGYEQLNGQITAKGTWDTSTGLTTLEPMLFSAENAADLSVSLAIGGYTPALVAGLQEMQKSMEGNEQALGMAMLGLMQQLDVRSIKIGVNDNSLTGRLLDFFGSQQGMNRESTVAFAKGMLPLGLAQLGNPDFAARASAAIGQFLDDPKSLTIEAAPANPVPAAAIMGAAASNPASLIDVLAVKITANE